MAFGIGLGFAFIRDIIGAGGGGGDNYLLETGDDLLLETGDNYLLE